MKSFALFLGTANPHLARETAKLLHKDLGKLEIVTFADSEKRVRIEEDVAEKMCFVIASLSNPVDTHLVEFCLIGDALKQNDCAKLVAVIPYYGYARQDKAHREGEGISARVMAKLIQAVGYDRVIAVDLHSELVGGYFHIPLTHLSAQQLFANELLKNSRGYVVVSPDAGGAKRAQHFAEILKTPLVFMEKKRNLQQIHTLDWMNVIGEVAGKTAVLFDDVITSGSTLVKAAYILKERGAKEVIACATHADFIEGTRRILDDSPLDKVFVTDSILVKTTERMKKLEIVSLAPLLAEQIKKMI